MFSVVGVTNEDYATGNEPARRLGDALDEQSLAERPSGPAVTVVVYGVDGTAMETLAALRDRYQEQGRFISSTISTKRLVMLVPNLTLTCVS